MQTWKEKQSNWQIVDPLTFCSISAILHIIKKLHQFAQTQSELLSTASYYGSGINFAHLAAPQPASKTRRNELLGRRDDLIDRHGRFLMLEVENVANFVACAEEEIYVGFGMRSRKAEPHSRSDERGSARPSQMSKIRSVIENELTDKPLRQRPREFDLHRFGAASSAKRGAFSQDGR